MNIFEVICLGVIQGITEFIPVSSSGHLVLAHNLFQIDFSNFLLNMSLHVSTLIAIIWVLHKDIFSIIITLLNFSKIIRKYGSLKKSYIKSEKLKLLVLLGIGSIPTALIGFVFKLFYPFFCSSTNFIGFMLLLSGSFLWLSKISIFDIRKRKNILEMNIRDSIIIGIVQGIAIIPGMSRSGSTISTGLMLGMDHELAGRFSFLLSIPAVLGACIFSLYSIDIQLTTNILKLIIIGSIISTTIGYITLKLMFHIIKLKYIHIFTPYCYLLGFVIILITI